MTDERFEPTPDNCTIDGTSGRAYAESWFAFDWASKEWREKASAMIFIFGDDAPDDQHWRVPMPHLETFHRVRLRTKPHCPKCEGAGWHVTQSNDCPACGGSGLEEDEL